MRDGLLLVESIQVNRTGGGGGGGGGVAIRTTCGIFLV